MTIQVEMGKFEVLRAKWEAQQSRPDNNALPPPTTPGRTPAYQRKFYSSSTETRESKVRRFSSFAAFTSPINPFYRRDRSGMPFPNSPSSKALVAADDRQDPPPPQKRGPASRLPSFRSTSNNMLPPPPLAASRHRRQETEQHPLPRLPRSQTTSNIPLLTSSTSSISNSSTARRTLSGIPSRKTTGLRQPSQSTSDLIRSRPPTPHRSADVPIPVAAHSTNSLISLVSSSSSNNVRSKLPTPTVAKDTRQAGVATKMFAGTTRTLKANTKRSYTQPNLPSAASVSAQLTTPRRTVFREEFATKTPRYMASENVKPGPTIDDFFGISDEPDEEELRRWGVVGKEAWNSPRVVNTPLTIKPRRMSGVRPTQLPRLHSAGSLPQHGLLAPLSPPFPRTPRHSTAHSQSLPPPGSGVSRPNILRDSQLSPCPEDPKTAIRMLPTGYPRSWSPPTSPSPTPASPSPPPSPTPMLFDPRTVTTAEPSSYWAGRFMALFDRLRFESFHNEGRAFRLTGRVSDTFGAFVEGGEDQRAKRVFGELASCCITEEAAKSLREFQVRWAEKEGSVMCMPPPAIIMLGNSEGLRGGGEEEEGRGRKTGMGFMDRLRGIARKTGP